MPSAERVTLRKLRVLVEHLPEDSALVRAVRGHNWRVEHYQLAAVMDGLSGVAWAVFQAQSRKKVKRPESVERPDREWQKTHRGRVGHVDADDRGAAVAYLIALQPGGGDD